MAKLPMGDLLAHHAARDPDRFAVICANESITYGDLDRWANRLARAYAAQGVGVGDLVTIALPNGLEFYAAAFATWKLGAIPQPLPHRLPPPERDALIDLAEPALVVGMEPEASRGRPSVPRGFQPSEDTLAQLAHALSELGRHQAQVHRQLTGQHHAAADGLTMKPPTVAQADFNGVAKGVAEVQDRAPIAFALVLGDDGRLDLA